MHMQVLYSNSQTEVAKNIFRPLLQARLLECPEWSILMKMYENL